MYFDPAEMGAFVNGLGSNFLILLLSVLPILGANRRLSRSVLTVTDQIIRTTWLCVFVVFIIWTPMDFLGGFLIDSRQVVLTLGAFFLGPIPAFFAVIAGTIARAIASPVGVIFGFWSLFASAIVGLGFRFWAVRMRRTPNIGFFLLMGFSAQVVWHSSSVFLLNRSRIPFRDLPSFGRLVSWFSIFVLFLNISIVKLFFPAAILEASSASSSPLCDASCREAPLASIYAEASASVLISCSQR